MTTKFPEALDTFDNPNPDTSQAQVRTHSRQHSDANDAVEAIEMKIGINESADPDSIDFKVGALENFNGSLGSAAFEPVESFGRFATEFAGMKVPPSLRSAKPSAKNVIRPMIDDRIANPFERWYPARFSVGGKGVVLKDLMTYAGGPGSPPAFFIYLPEVAGVDYEFFVKIDAPGGADAATVSQVRFNGDNAGGATSTTVSGSAGEYTSTYTGVSGGSNVGLRVVFTPAVLGDGHLFVIREMTIKANGTEVARLSSRFGDIFTSIASRGASAGPLLKQDMGGWLIAHNDVVTGRNPRVLWASPSSSASLPANNSSMFEMADQENPMSAQWTSIWARTYQRNGFTDIPARGYFPGTYDMAAWGSNGQPVYVNTSFGDILAFAPFGPAYFVQNNGACDGVIYANQARGADGQPPKITVYLWGIHCGTGPSINGTDTSNCCEVPVRLLYVGKIYAFDCSLSWSSAAREANGWWIQDSDSVLEKCTARRAGRDNFNYHGYGHAALVDCEAYDATDDGCSPHDLCTYEIWGGVFEANAKGNVIPAFGAQGYCIGVSSRLSTGQGSAVEGTNDGGFVCLSTNSDTRPTTMICIDCTSDGDTNGYNAAGSRSTLQLIGCSSANATRAGITNGNWRTNTAGRIVDSGSTFSANAANVILANQALRAVVQY